MPTHFTRTCLLTEVAPSTVDARGGRAALRVALPRQAVALLAIEPDGDPVSQAHDRGVH